MAGTDGLGKGSKAQPCHTVRPKLTLAKLLDEAPVPVPTDISVPIKATPAPTRPLPALPPPMENTALNNQSAATLATKKGRTAINSNEIGNEYREPNACVSIFESSSEESEEDEPPTDCNGRSRKVKWQREIWTEEHARKRDH